MLEWLVINDLNQFPILQRFTGFPERSSGALRRDGKIYYKKNELIPIFKKYQNQVS